jgi:transmembrane sensor
VRRRRWPHVNRVLAVAVLALLVLVATRFLPSRGAIDGATLVTGARERQSLELGDGSHIALEPSTKLQLERVSGRDIRLRVESGAVNANVTHVANRPFTVVAGPVEVHVVGTKFRVERDPGDGDIVVSVTEGRVSLTRSDGAPVPSTLGAGETWSSEAARMAAPEPSPVTDADASPAVEPHERSAAHVPVLSKQFRDAWRDGRFAAAWAEIPSAGFDTLIATAGPKDVFAIAESARMSGHPREAAKAFDALRHRFRSDARAPLAALELGRLRLSEFGSPLEAKEAFEDAIALDPNGSFREDSEARRIEALEAAGLTAECAEARDRYIATYPGGLHERIVTRRCR